MIRSRIIPFLLLQNDHLVKTTKFGNPKYVGDPINTVRIFNEKEVDELALLSIDSTVESKPPNLQLISKLATECRMPLTYGGGIKTVDQVEQIIGYGIEKISISSIFFENINMVREAVNRVGSQSISLVVDIMLNPKTGGYSVYTHNGQKYINETLFDVISKATDVCVGEIILNFIDRDGTLMGFDVDFIKDIKSVIKTQLTVVGGAGSYDDIKNLNSVTYPIGIGVGSLFVFKGKFRAVLVQYPGDDIKNSINQI